MAWGGGGGGGWQEDNEMSWSFMTPFCTIWHFMYMNFASTSAPPHTSLSPRRPCRRHETPTNAKRRDLTDWAAMGASKGSEESRSFIPLQPWRAWASA
uniref:Uncharacterized protein n=1 Tax=Zea mays TaxID=4577 RepID=B4FXV4_MAIZE|nr:unknown [Zea mays]